MTLYTLVFMLVTLLIVCKLEMLVKVHGITAQQYHKCQMTIPPVYIDVLEHALLQKIRYKLSLSLGVSHQPFMDFRASRFA